MTNVTIVRPAVSVVLEADQPPVVTPAAPTVPSVTLHRETNVLSGTPSYVHTQSSAASTWIVNHNLGRTPPAVSVRTVGGVEVIADVIHVSVNQLQVNFNAPATGSVHVQ